MERPGYAAGRALVCLLTLWLGQRIDMRRLSVAVNELCSFVVGHRAGSSQDELAGLSSCETFVKIGSLKQYRDRPEPLLDTVSVRA